MLATVCFLTALQANTQQTAHPPRSTILALRVHIRQGLRTLPMCRPSEV